MNNLKKYKLLNAYRRYEFSETLDAAFDKPPKKQLEYLKSRGKKIVTADEWDRLEKQSHDKAFTVAKVVSADVLQEIYDYVEYGIKQGWNTERFIAEAKGKLRAAGWTDANASRLKVMYETNKSMAYARGKYRSQKLIADRYPFWEYRQIQRKTKRHDHSKLDKKVFRHDDKIWEKIYPPSGYGCKCTVTPRKTADKVEDGAEILKTLNDKDYNISPLKAWQPSTKKYVAGIQKKLKAMIKPSAKVEDEPLLKKPPKIDVGKQTAAGVKKYFADIDVDKFIAIKNNAVEYYKNHPKIDKAFTYYSGAGYEDMNMHMRGVKPGNKFTTGNVDAMNDDFETKLKSDVTVYRGMREPDNNDNDYQKKFRALFNALASGKRTVFSDAAFLSTSVDPSVAQRFGFTSEPGGKSIYLKTVIKKGVEVGVGKMGNYGERELIFKGDTQFKILSIKKMKNELYVEMELI